MPKSTQNYLDVAEIKQDTVVLKDGALRAVILVSSVNFALKSEDEQKALIGSYVTMLNTLEYPIHILIQSRRMNIDEYLHNLEERAKAQTNELLKVHTRDYLEFVREIITLGNIMSKKFYAVVPFNEEGEARQGFFKRLFGVFTPTKVIQLKEERFLKLKLHLDKRVDNVLTGLVNMNLNATRLDTGALIELFYTTYNPTESQMQKLGNVAELQVETN